MVVLQKVIGVVSKFALNGTTPRIFSGFQV